jgi:outer membrane protein OmpA-like peptidoglycan-associated protein
MNFPPFDDPIGKKVFGERPKVKAPADLNWDAIETKIRQRKQTGTAGPKYDSGKYLAQMREEDPWPTKDERNTNAVSLINCRFLTPSEDLMPDEACTVACDLKILQPPSTRSLTFRLQYRLKDSDPWTDSNESAIASLNPDATDQTVQIDLTLYCPMPEPGLGSMLHYRVVAEHSEAASDAEGPDTPVQLRNRCHFVGAPEIAFENDSACPSLNAPGGLVDGLAAAVKQLSAPQPMGPQSVVVFGFASSSGTEDHDRDLSSWRAQAVTAILDRDTTSWAKLASAHFGTRDIQGILSGLSKDFDWPCDPGTVDGVDGPKTRSGVKAFQVECNARFSLHLAEDGICGPKTWGAVHRTICALVSQALGQNPSQEPSWPEVPWGYPEGKGIVACGKDFADSADSAQDRHAEIHFFGSNMEPTAEDLAGEDEPAS